MGRAREEYDESSLLQSPLYLQSKKPGRVEFAHHRPRGSLARCDEVKCCVVSRV